MPTPLPTSSTRWYVLDAARGIAVVTMVIAHTMPYVRSITPAAVDFAVAALNPAAPLFALLVGLTMALTSRSAAASARGRSSYRRGTVARSVVLICLGLLLGMTYSGVSVVLDYLGVTLMATVPFIFLAPRALLVATAVVTLFGPLVVSAARAAVAAHPALIQPRTPVATIADWIVLGEDYRLLSLLPLFLLGLALGRIGLARGGLPAIRLIAVSALVFAACSAWGWRDMPGFDIPGGHYEVVRDIATAVGAFAVIYYLTDAATERVQRASRWLLTPFTAQGRMALSVYALHVTILIAIQKGWVIPDLKERLMSSHPPLGWLIQIGVLMVCWLFATLWWRWLGVGPLERVMGFVSGRHPLSSLWATPQPRSIPLAQH
ncbi:MAG: DUF418 domain-containing protein [Propioniciclava sp.]|uniref:DUF418 domain-containing protein n=1 Tax=Propioniciclava sp. TaxID=2038686 RepID=UPI0039E5E97C